MAVKHFNRVKVAVTTTGTGAVTPGAAYARFRNFEEAGVAEGDEVRYVLEQGNDWELGDGTYSSGTLLRNVTESTNGDEPIDLDGTAVLYLTPAAADFVTVAPATPSFLETILMNMEGGGADGPGFLTILCDNPDDQTILDGGTA